MAWAIGKPNVGILSIGVCCRQPDQSKEVDEVFFKQLKKVSCLQALVLTGELNQPNICSKGKN